MSVRLSQHLLAHTSGRLGLVFGQQTVEMVVQEGPLTADVRVPLLEANVKTECLDATVECPRTD